MGKEQSFAQTLLGQVGHHLQNNEVGRFPHTYTNVNSKRVKDRSVRAKPIKPSEENTGENLCDFGLDKILLDMTLEAQVTK